MAGVSNSNFGSLLAQLQGMMRPAIAPAAPAVPAPSPGLGSDQFVRSQVPVPPGGSFQIGMQGPAVTALQSKLVALGYLAGTPDGVYSMGTAQAVWYYQYEHGRMANGWCDASDLARIDAELAGQAPRVRPAPTPFPPAPPATGRTITVLPGQTLSDLARIYLGDMNRWQELWALNQDLIADPNRLQPGSILRLPANALVPSPDTVAPSKPPSTLGARAVEIAKQYQGVQYVWGGTTPKGFDCSGLVQYVYKQMGLNIPRVAADQFKAGTPVAPNQLQPGDAVFFHDTGSRHGITHVGMYVGDGKFIQAPKTGDVVKISDLSDSYYQQHYAGARRYV